MPPKLRLWIGTIFLVLISLLAAFFIVFNSVFSDVLNIGDRMMTYGITAGVYFVLGLIAAAMGPTRPWRWIWILTVPAVTILVVYTYSEPQNILIHASFAALVPLASWAGASAGVKLRTKRKEPR